jgi:hypothetical protein
MTVEVKLDEDFQFARRARVRACMCMCVVFYLMASPSLLVCQFTGTPLLVCHFCAFLYAYDIVSQLFACSPHRLIDLIEAQAVATSKGLGSSGKVSLPPPFSHLCMLLQCAMLTPPYLLPRYIPSGFLSVDVQFAVAGCGGFAGVAQGL